jgi:hypothetical protein
MMTPQKQKHTQPEGALFKNIIFTHCTDSGVFKPTEVFLKDFFEGEIPPNIFLSNNEEAVAKILESTQEKTLVICAGKTHWRGHHLMARNFAEAIKKEYPNTFIVGYSQSTLHKDNPIVLDAYILRGMLADMNDFKNTKKHKEATWYDMYFNEYRIAKFIHGAWYCTNEQDLQKLFLSDDKLFTDK